MHYHGNLSLHDAALLARTTSEVDSAPPPNWSLLQSTTQEFEQGHSYRCHVFVNILQGMMVFSHGIALQEKAFEASLDLSDVGVSLALEEPPVGYEIAREFTQDISHSMEAGNRYQYLASFAAHHVGEGLGGAHAHLCGYWHNAPVVTFDSPGTRVVLEQLFGFLSSQQISQHHTLTLDPSFTNSSHHHVGRLYRFCPDDKPEEPVAHEDESALILFQQPQQFKLVAQEGDNQLSIRPFNSRFNSKLRCTSSVWTVSMINAGSMLIGDPMIFVEGIKEGRLYVASFKAVSGSCTVSEYNRDRDQFAIETRRDAITHIAIMEENNYDNFEAIRREKKQKLYWECQSTSRSVSVKQVEAMIESIKRDAAQARRVASGVETIDQLIPYQRFGPKDTGGPLAWLFSKDNAGLNCTSYCIEKLEAAGIPLATWHKAEKAAGGCRIA